MEYKMEYKEKFALTDVAFAYLMGRDSKTDLGGNATGFYAECQGKCDANRLEKAINCVIARQPMLRTVIFEDGTQAELKEIPTYHLPVEDLRHLSEEEIDRYFETYRQKQSHRIFPLESWPMYQIALFQLTDEISRVVISFDMMLVDRFSIEILINELNEYYQNPDVELKPLSNSYHQYVKLSETARQNRLQEDKTYWETVIPDMPLAPPIRIESDESSGNRFASLVHIYSTDFYQKLQEQLYDKRILPSVYMLYCYGKCLSRFSSAQDLSVSMTVSDRAPMGQIFSDVIGDFTKLLLVDLHYDDSSWVNSCKTLQKRIKLYMKHGSYTGLDVMKEIARREQLGGKAAFPFAFTSRLTSQDESYWDFLGEVQYQISRTPQLAVDCQISEHQGTLEVRWDYLTGTLPESFLQEMFHYYLDLIANEFCDIQATSGIPYETIEAYNQTAEEIPSVTLQTLLEKQACKTPDRPALSVHGKTYTYSQLHKASNAVASVLFHRYGSGNTIMVDGKRSAETIFVILGILKSGNAYVPFDHNYPQKRIDAIRESCNAVTILNAESYTELLAEGDPEFTPIFGDTQDVAYIIFTSGSTGVPKGVVITQDAVCNTILDINQRFQITEEDCIIGISSFWFDLSVYDIFGAFSTGAHLVLSEKVEIEHLLNLMQTYPITFWNTVPAIMDLLVCSGRELPGETLKNVLLSGDWIPLELPQKILETFPNASVCSLGGATEASIWSIYYPIENVDKNWKSIPYGYPLANQTIYILNQAGELCPIGVQGEICIGGRGVAKEYCGNQEETQAHFVEHPKYGRIYRTGDYGCMSTEGYVVFLGRMDQQVKLHGFRIELGEIEAALMKHDNVEKALATIVKNDSGASLIAAYIVCKVSEAFNEEDVLRTVEERVPEYMVPSLLIPMDAFPLTANGKIDRKALPIPKIAEKSKQPPQTEMEKLIAEIWQDELALSDVSRNDNFFYLGGDSLIGLRVASRIKQRIDVKVDIAEIFSMPILQDFCAELEKRTASDTEIGIPALSIDFENENQPFPLTDVQRSYWIGAQNVLSMGGVTTHAFCEVVCENLDLECLEYALNQVIAEQGMMRAIVQNDGQQRILKQVPHYAIAVHNVNEQEFESTLQNIRSEMEHERFNPSEWPLFKIEAVQCAEKTILFVDLDNLIFDGYSVQLLFFRWNAYYEKKQEVKPLSLSFRDYVLALNQLKKTERYEIDRQYWQEQVETMHPAPELFTQVSPDKLQAQTIMHLQTELDTNVWHNLQENSKRNGLTVSSVLLTAYAQMLSLWSRKSAFTINLTQYNRLFEHAEINDLIGDFTLLSMLSVDMRSNSSFVTYAQQIQKDLSNHMAHPYYGGVEVQQDYARSNQRDGVIFPVVFTSTVGMTSDELTDKLFGTVERITTETPQVWLDCQVTELDGGLRISFEAVKELFQEKTVEAMLNFFRKLLVLLSESVEIWNVQINDILYQQDMIPTLKRREKLSELAPVDNGMTLENLFVEQAKRTPKHIAVIDAEREMTYDELYYEAYLLSQEIKNHNQKIVAILMKKGWRQVVAVLATLMAGAAYLPLDVGNPDIRIQEILKKAEVELILTEAELCERVVAFDKKYLVVSQKQFTGELPEHICQCKSDNLAYIIFTSGSTGTPKGVMISHRGAVNTILDVNTRFDIGEGDRTIALSALNFDLSVYDIFGMLCCGGAIVIPSESDRKDPDRLAVLLKQHKVTVWNSVPAFMQLLADNVDMEKYVAQLRVIMMSGDWIPVSLPDKIKSACPNVKIYSLGGATEASIWSNYYPVEEVVADWRSIPYGYPLSGQGFRILNEKMQDCPPMVIGKLYISGTGVAMGYLNDEQLTAERFITYTRTGERLYDTGDLGMYWEDGTMEFFGREDFQVKIRGHRIELGEIEAALLNSEVVQETSVFTVKVKGRTHIAAAVVTECEEEAFPTDSVLKIAKSRLPEYMIPSVIFIVPNLPLTANGKIDRKSLAKQGEEILLKQKNEEAPVEMTEIEQLVAATWQEVLGLDELPNLHEEFFDYGGDSLDIVKIRTKLSEMCGKEIEMADIFMDPTVSGMAALLQ